MGLKERHLLRLPPRLYVVPIQCEEAFACAGADGACVGRCFASSLHEDGPMMSMPLVVCEEGVGEEERKK